MPLDKIPTSKVQPITALKIFMFFFVGGVIGIGYDLLDGSPELVPLVIVLAGLGAVACVETVIRLARREALPANEASDSSQRMARPSAKHPENCDKDHVGGGQA